MTRRANTEGSIYKRGARKKNGDGRWVGSLMLASGRRKSYYGKTRDEVARKLRTAQKSVDDGLPLVSDKRTVEAFLTEWLQGVAPSLRPRTWLRYGQLLKVHVYPFVGSMPLSKLTPNKLQSLLAERLSSGSSPSTVRQMRAVLHRAFKQGVTWRVLAVNPADSVSPPKVERTAIKALSVEEIQRFITAAESERLNALWALLITSGCRLGEALALTWDKVKLDEGTVGIEGTLQNIGGVYSVEPTKTARSRRTVPLTAVAVEALRRHKSAMAAERLAFPGDWPKEWLGLVFTNEFGKPIDGRMLRARFEPMLSRAGLPRMRIHDLRHAAISWMLAQGVPARVVADVVGHSSTTLTLDTYGHLIEGQTRSAAAALDAALAGGS